MWRLCTVLRFVGILEKKIIIYIYIYFFQQEKTRINRRQKKGICALVFSCKGLEKRWA